MTGEASGQTRRAQRTLVDRRAHALTQCLRSAVETLARSGDDRLAPWQGASERAQVGAKALGEAQDRATAARVQIRHRGEELDPDRRANSAAAVGVGARKSAA